MGKANPALQFPCGVGCSGECKQPLLGKADGGYNTFLGKATRAAVPPWGSRWGRSSSPRCAVGGHFFYAAKQVRLHPLRRKPSRGSSPFLKSVRRLSKRPGEMRLDRWDVSSGRRCPLVKTERDWNFSVGHQCCGIGLGYAGDAVNSELPAERNAAPLCGKAVQIDFLRGRTNGETAVSDDTAEAPPLQARYGRSFAQRQGRGYKTATQPWNARVTAGVSNGSHISMRRTDAGSRNIILRAVRMRVPARLLRLMRHRPPF